MKSLGKSSSSNISDSGGGDTKHMKNRFSAMADPNFPLLVGNLQPEAAQSDLVTGNTKAARPRFNSVVSSSTIPKCKKATITTSGDRVQMNELAKLVSIIKRKNVLQITPMSNEIRINTIMDYDLAALDSLEGVWLSSKVQIKSVNYEGKRPKILLTVVGLNIDTPDEELQN